MTLKRCTFCLSEKEIEYLQALSEKTHKSQSELLRLIISMHSLKEAVS